MTLALSQVYTKMNVLLCENVSSENFADAKLTHNICEPIK